MPAFPIHRDAATAAFLDGTAEEKFLIVRDTATGEFHSPQFDLTTDPDRYRLVAAEGTGLIVSWSVVHQKSATGPTRTVVGIVQLDEGPWWWSEIAGADPDADLAGARVAARFHRVGAETDPEAETIPFFQLIS